MKIVLDTDVVVAGMRSRKGASRFWMIAALRQEVELLLSVPLVLQYEDVLLRQEQLTALNATAEEIESILDALCRVGRPVEISYIWRPTLRDPGDEMVLELAVQGQADRLLTFNEKDFVGAERFGITAMRPGPAWKAWKGRTAS